MWTKQSYLPLKSFFCPKYEQNSYLYLKNFFFELKKALRLFFPNLKGKNTIFFKS